jgi:hypothetical protein
MMHTPPVERKEPKVNDELVTLATFDNAIKAELARAALAEAGIESQLGDESLVTNYWLLSEAVGGVKLVIKQSDADRAVAVFKGIEEHLNEDATVDEDELTRQALAAERESGEAS